MKAKRLRGLLMQVLFDWTNNAKFRGSDTEGQPVVMEVVSGTAKQFVVEVRSGHAGSDEAQQFKVTVKVEKL